MITNIPIVISLFKLVQTKRMRESEREREREGGLRFVGWKEFSVFISNIPEKLDKYGLKGIFNKAGKVSDVYIPEGKVTASRRRYGFVRFWKWHEARRSIQMLNNTNIRGCKISVSMAKYAKGCIGTKEWQQGRVCDSH